MLFRSVNSPHGRGEGGYSPAVRPNRLLLRLVPPLALGLGACPPDVAPRDGGIDARTGDIRLELGSGQLAWEDLAPGGRVELIHGPQGGYHIFGRVRFDRLGPDVRVSFRVTPAEGGAPLTDPDDRIRLAEGRGLRPVDGAWECSGPLLVVLVAVNSAAAADALVGRRCRFEATVTSLSSGQSATVAREVTIANDT